MNSTIEYYNKNAKSFVAETINANMNDLYSKFEKHIQSGCKILDLGCGSGRDCKYFKRKGYDVIAVDPSEKMCDETRKIAEVPVFQMGAEEMKFHNEFDGIWACASLLHIPNDGLNNALWNAFRALKKNGILYASWKVGVHERNIEGRFFNDFTEERLRKYLEGFYDISLLDLWMSEDKRDNKEETKWINVLMKKMNEE